MNELELFKGPTDEAGPDWAKIKADFEAGSPSLREIAARERVSDTAIRKRAKAEGWNAGSRQGSQQVRTPCEPPVRTTCEPVVHPVFKHVQIPETKDDGFRWDADNPDVVVFNTPSFAVYVNPFNKIVIRADSYGDDDPFVCIDPRDVPALIERLRKLTGAAR